MSKQTPLQQVLQECDRLASSVAQTGDGLRVCREMKTFLKNHLPSEKQFADEMWDNGYKLGVDVVVKSKEMKISTLSNFETYYKQYEP